MILKLFISILITSFECTYQTHLDETDQESEEYFELPVSQDYEEFIYPSVDASDTNLDTLSKGSSSDITAEEVEWVISTTTMEVEFYTQTETDMLSLRSEVDEIANSYEPLTRKKPIKLFLDKIASTISDLYAEEIDSSPTFLEDINQFIDKFKQTIENIRINWLAKINNAYKMKLHSILEKLTEGLEEEIVFEEY